MWEQPGNRSSICIGQANDLLYETQRFTNLMACTKFLELKYSFMCISDLIDFDNNNLLKKLRWMIDEIRKKEKKLNKNNNQSKIFAYLITYSCRKNDFIIRYIHNPNQTLLDKIAYDL